MSWDQSVALILGGAWRANAARPALRQRNWALKQQYRTVGRARATTRVQPTFGAFGGVTAPQATAPSGRQPASFPQKIDVQAPWSWRSEVKPATRPSTAGNPLASLGASVGSAVGEGGYLNLGNAIPWLMERPMVGVKEVATQITGDDDNIVNQGIDALAGVLTAAAQPVAAVMDAPINWYRDSALGDRAKVYRALVNRTKLGGLSFLMSGSAPVDDLNRLLSLIEGGADGQQRERAEKALAVLAEAIDIPDALKREIEGKPDISDDEINKLYDKIGRQLSYKEGIEGLIGNGAIPLLVYGAEAIGTFGLAGMASKGAQAATFAAQLGKPLSLTGQALRYGAWAGRPIFAIQKYAVASGLGYLGVEVIADAALRTMGNEEGVAFIDKLNRSVLFSDDPAVQLVSAFAVDPVAAVKLAKAGTFGLARTGAGIAVGRATGRRMVALWDNDDLLYRVLGKAYGVEPSVARNLIGEAGYESKGQAWDSLVRLASDVLTAKDSPLRLVGAEKWAGEIAAHSRTEAFLRANFGRVLDVIEKHPEQLASRLRKDWADVRLMPGPFNPWEQVRIEVGYQRMAEITERARAEIDAVLGLPDALAPRAQELARDYVGQMFSTGREVTVADMQAFLRRFPGARYHWQSKEPLWTDLGTFSKVTDKVERPVFEQIIERAAQAYDDLVKRNPVRARTAHDPILRPGSASKNRDWGDALGTTEPTIEALFRNPTAWRAGERDLVRSFARDKLGLSDDLLARMPDEELWTKVNDHAEKVTAPWVKRGAEVETAEKALASLDAEAQAIRVEGRTTGAARLRTWLTPEATARLAIIDQERARLLNLMSDAIDPVTPFSQSVRFARPASGFRATVDRANRIVDAQERLARINAVVEASEGFSWPSAPKGGVLSMLADVNGQYVWTGGRALVPDSLLARYNRFKAERGGASRLGYEPGVTVPEMWSRLGRELRESMDFGKTLTPSQRSMILRNLGGDNLDEWAAAWSKTGNSGDFLEYLTGLRREYDDALNGSRLTDISKTAGAAAPDWAIAEARAIAEDMWHNPLAISERTLARAEIKRALSSEDTFPAAAELIAKDAELYAKAEQMAGRAGLTTHDFLRDPANREALGSLVPDEPGVVPGVPAAATALDDAVLAGDAAALGDLKAQLADLQGRIAEPARNVSPEAAAEIMARGRPSRNLTREIDQAGLSWQDSLAAEAWAGREVAQRGASVILWGNMEQTPRTIGSLVRVLREIENGNASNLGMGDELLAEVQRGIHEVVGREITAARQAGFDAGMIGMGKGLRPWSWAQDTYDELRQLFGKEGRAGAIAFDDEGAIVYGLKQRPSEAVVMEMSTVPGLVEELMSARFVPFETRLGTARIRQTFNMLFGGKHNQEIFFEASQRFSARLLEAGIPEPVSRSLWKAWGEASRESHELLVKKGYKGQVKYLSSGMALYASPKNIPNSRLGAIAQEVLMDKLRGAYRGGMSEEAVEAFRIATSDVRRVLADRTPVMGDLLQKMYGKFAHNAFVTTWYYWFRFGLDMRFRAMEAMEGPMLYAGKAALRPGEIGEGMFGMDMASIARVADDAMLNTGLPFNITRDGWVYKTLLKEQPDGLRALVVEDPELFERAVRQVIEHDPELAQTIRLMGDTPDAYLKVMDEHWGKLMRDADPAAYIDSQLAREMAEAPEMAEAFSRISQRNHQLLDDIRATFYGNPNRSQVERWLNSYLLYWPLSYQIKASKWLLRIMYDRAGGLKTNAAGAYAMDAAADMHMDLLANDPEYARWFEEHPTLVFAAQMLLPITPTQAGISLSPPVRDILAEAAAGLPFLSELQKDTWGGYAKAVGDIGPVYTIKALVPRIAGELYRDFGDLPGADAAFRMAAGRKPPKKQAPPEEDLWQPEPYRWGQ